MPLTTTVLHFSPKVLFFSQLLVRDGLALSKSALIPLIIVTVHQALLAQQKTEHGQIDPLKLSFSGDFLISLTVVIHQSKEDILSLVKRHFMLG